jgi:hypothetical protein
VQEGATRGMGTAGIIAFLGYAEVTRPYFPSSISVSSRRSWSTLFMASIFS